jgi:hypothetical protein
MLLGFRILGAHCFVDITKCTTSGPIYIVDIRTLNKQCALGLYTDCLPLHHRSPGCTLIHHNYLLIVKVSMATSSDSITVDALRSAVAVEDFNVTLKSYNERSLHLASKNEAIILFQNFTNLLIDALIAHDPETVRLINAQVPQSILSKLPLGDGKRGAKSFYIWIKDGMLKHPFRRTPAQVRYLAVAHLQYNNPDLPMGPKIAQITAYYKDWEARVYAPENLVEDPDTLYYLRRMSKISDAERKDCDGDDACLFCTDNYDEGQHSPKRGLCGHVFCALCFDIWLQQSSGKYTCATCRTCLVCGRGQCKAHVVKTDMAPPMPLTGLIDAELPNKKGEVLHDIRPDRYWTLREDTRADRALLTYIDSILVRDSAGRGHQLLLKDEQIVKNRIAAKIRLASTNT